MLLTMNALILNNTFPCTTCILISRIKHSSSCVVYARILHIYSFIFSWYKSVFSVLVHASYVFQRCVCITTMVQKWPISVNIPVCVRDLWLCWVIMIICSMVPSLINGQDGHKLSMVPFCINKLQHGNMSLRNSVPINMQI